MYDEWDDEARGTAYLQEVEQRRVSLAEFLACPIDCLRKARNRSDGVTVTEEGRSAYIVMDAVQFAQLIDDYLAAVRKAGMFTPELEAIYDRDQLIRNPGGHA